MSGHSALVASREANSILSREMLQDLDAQGWCTVTGLLGANECAEVISEWSSGAGFRKTVSMARHGYGRGEYRYFKYPLPGLVESLRQKLYPELAVAANRWASRLGIDQRFPEHHSAYRAHCAAQGQSQATPLILRYGPGDFNCLHQDLYGEEVFPLQVAVLLSEPGGDFDGGEFVLTEQLPRRQSRAHVVPLRHRGDAVIFAVNACPRPGQRGFRRAYLRHGVSVVRSGERFTLGIIFHDAR